VDDLTGPLDRLVDAIDDLVERSAAAIRSSRAASSPAIGSTPSGSWRVAVGTASSPSSLPRRPRPAEVDLDDGLAVDSGADQQGVGHALVARAVDVTAEDHIHVQFAGEVVVARAEVRERTTA